MVALLSCTQYTHKELNNLTIAEMEDYLRPYGYVKIGGGLFDNRINMLYISWSVIQEYFENSAKERELKSVYVIKSITADQKMRDE